MPVLYDNKKANILRQALCPGTDRKVSMNRQLRGI